MKKIGILGANGRMGQMISKLIREQYSDRAEVSAEISEGDSFEGLLDCNVVIDFSLPQAFRDWSAFAESKSTLPPFVLGTTGFTKEDDKLIADYSQRSAVLKSTNFSTGVLALHQILKHATPMLESLGYDLVLTETHHKHKKDAPSGTAKSLQKTLRPNSPESVQTHAIRAGEVFGDHEVTYFGVADQISIAHHAQDRTIFTRGAIDAALWLSSQKNPKGMISIERYFQENFRN